MQPSFIVVTVGMTLLLTGMVRRRMVVGLSGRLLLIFHIRLSIVAFTYSPSPVSASTWAAAASALSTSDLV